ncbi:GyrI-like domain-containing protein [Hasllibacter sp. MH4015]|uniref:GyrI-like domain-containing protein n=1 Tax=Hasllibacter sp. MH4015 TaxID=2854029 RepID=UPI001CD338C6|nr:GyrI-like domain-containing protein [Hasllibacter sp. MH4015]
MDVHRKILPEQSYIYVDRECPFGPEIADAMGSAFAEVFGFVGQASLTPLSMPMAVYTVMDPKLLRFRGAVMVSPEDAAKASGAIKAETLPAGDAMHAVHVGPYDNLNQTHRALWDYMGAEGIKGTMPVWEIYVDDPAETTPEDLRTEIYCAIE